MEKYRTEERMLAEAAEQDRRTRQMPSAARRSAAVRRGMERAKGRTNRRAGFAYGGIGAAAFVAGALLIGYSGLAGEGQPSSESAASTQAKNLPQLDPTLEPFYPLVMRQDLTIGGALKRGAVTPIDTGSERAGFALDIQGAVRDSRSLTLFYTLKGPNGDRLSLDKPKLLDASTGKTAMWEDDYALPIEQFDVLEHAQYGVLTLPLRPEFSDSEQFTLKASALSGRSVADDARLQTFDVPLTIASTAAEEEDIVFEQPRKFTVEGQSLEIERLRVTPLRIYLTLSEDTYKVFYRLVNPRLVVRDGGREQTLAREGIWPYPEQDGENYELVYANVTGNGHPDSISFRAEGNANTPKRSSAFVVDTDKSEVLRAPGDDYAASLSPDSTGLQRLTVTYPTSSKDWAEGRSVMFDINFLDADGNVHKMQTDATGTFGGGISNADGTASNYFYLEKLDYPQPLTFKVVSAPGWTRNEQEITLK
ncbi:hypothetical protein [Saccharibacillus deserti]|uniref:hypothetical protein n=1 Tax=Saccharibacillus deserti TaxID=1634444 RepID=UPI0015576852|nr:hypothetical protein [Saccharibacillus deserti]